MKTGKQSLSELARALELIEKQKVDLLVPTEEMQAFQTGGTGFSITGHGDFYPTDYAHQQVAGFCDIPNKHYDRLRRNYPGLWRDEMDNLMPKGKTRLVRGLNKNITEMRAFLSDRYSVIDNFATANQFLELALKNDAHVISSDVTERRMYIKAVFKNLAIPFPGKKGEVYLGICCSNSEIGQGPFSLDCFILASWCENGTFFADSRFKKIHLGRQNESGELPIEFMASDTRAATAKAIELQSRDFISQVATKERLTVLVNRLAEAKNEPIANPIKAVEVLTKQQGLAEGEKEGILMSLLKGDAGEVEQNRYGLSAAITQYSQAVDSYDRATELEWLGGEIINMPQGSWNQIALAA